MLCKLSDVRPGVPLPATFAWQVWDLARCKGSLGLRRSAGGVCVAGAALGALPRSRMYTLASPGLRRSAGGFCVAGAALGALPRGRMYALASLGLRRSAGGVCVTGAAIGALNPGLCRPHCQGVGCTPSAALPVAFAWQVRRTWCTAKGSDVRPGVPCSPPPCL